jgi:CheY-like chemotaxis protein
MGAATYDRQWSGSVANRKNLFRVLLIDDVTAMHRMVEDALEDVAEVRAADNGARGVQMAEQWHPDLIICDMLMPGLSGFETIVRIKAVEEVRNVPIILLSGVAEELKNFPALKDMVACIIPKPFELADLKSRVEELLTKRRAISSAAQANPPE